MSDGIDVDRYINYVRERVVDHNSFTYILTPTIAEILSTPGSQQTQNQQKHH